VTVNPPTGAGELIVTVAVLYCPPLTEFGLRVNETKFGANTVRTDCKVCPFELAEIMIVESTGTLVVESLKVVLDCPALTVIELGTLTKDELLANLTTIPPDPAGPVNVTVPTEPTPPTTVSGCREKSDNAGGVMVNFPETDVRASFAATATSTAVDTGFALAANRAPVDPAGIVTDAGMETAVELGTSFTTNPLLGAVPLRDTVPVEVKPL